MSEPERQANEGVRCKRAALYLPAFLPTAYKRKGQRRREVQRTEERGP